MNILIKYINPSLNIGLANVKNAWLLGPTPVQLSVAVHRGLLVYRLPGSGKRISYRSLKKGLVKTNIIITETLPAWL